MATYVIGDIQGCFDTLMALLAAIRYQPGRDRLWLTGDLVNRGPRSLEVLRWAAAESGVTAVLGNHDLVLLALAQGVRSRRASDTLDLVLDTPDRDGLLDWLIRRPLLYREGEWMLVHAGLLPSWTENQAETLAADAAEQLRKDPGGVLAVWGDRGWEPTPDEVATPDKAATPAERAAAFLRVVTGIRMVDAQGLPHPAYKGPPDAAPAGLRPWYEVPSSRAGTETLVFGHWAALGLYRGNGVVGVDTGCVWGNCLTAFCLETGEITQVNAREPAV